MRWLALCIAGACVLALSTAHGQPSGVEEADGEGWPALLPPPGFTGELDDLVAMGALETDSRREAVAGGAEA